MVRSKPSQAGRMGLMVVLLAMAISAVAVTPSSATNMGFKRSVRFVGRPTASLHWLSLPYLYAPNDVGTPAVLDAEDLCEDLGGAGIDAILRWDEPSSTFVEHPCGAAMPFALTEGISYGLRLLPDFTILANFTGGHDESFTYSIPPSGGGQLSWFSVPYHLRIPANGGDLRVTAEELCQQIGSADVLAIVRWDEPTLAYESYGCGSSFEAPFEIVRGEGYGVINRAGQTIGWQPIHF